MASLAYKRRQISASKKCLWKCKSNLPLKYQAFHLVFDKALVKCVNKALITTLGLNLNLQSSI